MFTQKASVQMFIATLFIIVPNWNQPRCLSTGEETKQSAVKYIHIVEYCLITQSNKLLFHATTWMFLQEI